MYHRRRLRDALFEAGYEDLAELIDSFLPVMLSETDIDYALSLNNNNIEFVELDRIYNNYK